MREDVEESEEGEDVGGFHPDSKSDRAGESGGDVAQRSCRQEQYKKKEQSYKKYSQATSLQN